MGDAGHFADILCHHVGFFQADGKAKFFATLCQAVDEPLKSFLGRIIVSLFNIFITKSSFIVKKLETMFVSQKKNQYFNISPHLDVHE